MVAEPFSVQELVVKYTASQLLCHVDLVHTDTAGSGGTAKWRVVALFGQMGGDVHQPGVLEGVADFEVGAQYTLVQDRAGGDVVRR